MRRGFRDIRFREVHSEATKKVWSEVDQLPDEIIIPDEVDNLPDEICLADLPDEI